METKDFSDSDEDVPLKLLGAQRRNSIDVSSTKTINEPSYGVKEAAKCITEEINGSHKVPGANMDVTCKREENSEVPRKIVNEAEADKTDIKVKDARKRRLDSSSSDSDETSSSSEDSSTSSSSSDSSDSSSSNKSEDEKPLKQVIKKRVMKESVKKKAVERKAGSAEKKSVVKRAAKSKVQRVRHTRVEDTEKEESKDDEFPMRMSTFNPNLRSKKEKLVAQLLVRWWYALPDWPPPGYDYTPDLEKRKLKCVSIDEWEDMEDVDGNGYTKTYQISNCPGVFRDPEGNAIDLRCKETCPSYSNFMQKSEHTLLQLIQKALSNQLEQLRSSCYNEDSNRKKLLQELDVINRQLREYESKLK